MKKWKWMLAAAAACVMLAAAPVYAAEMVSAGSDSLEEKSMKTSQLDKFEYVLYTPKNAQENMPLIVYLHGHNMGYIGNLAADSYTTLLCNCAAKQEQAYVLAPFLPPELDFGPKGMWVGIEPSLLELVESVADTYQIDRSRIYVIGSSMGADSAVQIIAHNPDTFACMVGVVPFHENSPMKKWEDGWGESFKNTPVWVFVEDIKGAKDMAQTMVEDITAAGGQAWVEVQEGTDHSSARGRVAANHKTDIYNWMLSVRKE